MSQGDMGLGHPSIDINQIKKDMNLESIQETISNLHKRRAFAYSTGKQDMINQLEMIIDVYVRAQNEILDDMFSQDDGPDLSGKIDIS